MAPRKGKDVLLDLCESTSNIGNTIAVHILEYLNAVKTPPHGFESLAVELLDTSRLLLVARAGLNDAARSRTVFPADITKELGDRFRQTHSTFVVLDQVVKRFLSNEGKQGFSKLGRGFRMMFADTEIEKLRLSLVKCRESLATNALVFTWSLGDHPLENVSLIGYTALAAVLDRPDPTHTSPPHTAKAPSSQAQPVQPPERPRSLRTAASARDVELLSTQHPSHPDLLSPIPTDNGVLSPAILGAPNPPPSSNTTRATDSYSTQGSTRLTGETASEITRMSSISRHDESRFNSYDAKVTKQPAIPEMNTDQAPRWTPKQRNATIQAGSKSALVSAVQQKNHRMVEQLLESGVPTDLGPEVSLLRDAISNHDLTTVRLLLGFGANPNARDIKAFTPLTAAVEASFFEAAEFLLYYGADPSVAGGPSQENPFALALIEGKFELAQLFLRHGVDVNAVMADGNTPLVRAMGKLTELSTIELMLLHNADPNRKNSHGETALFKAISAQRFDMVTILLDHGADPNLPGPKHMLWPAVHQPEVLALLLERGANLKRAPGVLELATSINSLEAVTTLLKHGADPNAKKDGIFTPLCTAIRDDRGHLVDILIDAGADPNLQASEFPAFKCITHHRPHLLPQVIAAGADPTSPKGILEVAVMHREVESLRFLLQHGVDPNARGPSGSTALTAAIAKGDLEMLDILVAHGADPGVRGQEWPIAMAVKNPTILAKLLPYIPTSKIVKGALEMAVVANQLESVKLLLGKGMNVEEKNGGVFSPLTTSIREDRKDIFRYLIDEAGADPNSPGEHLPIIKAIRRHREDDLSYIEHLLEKGADINLMYRGWNAVLQALDNGDMQILSLLADKGHPDLNARDESGRTVSEIMEERGLMEEQQILLGGRSPSPEMKTALRQLRGLVAN